MSIKPSIALLTVCAAASAQTSYWHTEPRGYEDKAGNYHSMLFGAYAYSRMEFVNYNYPNSEKRYIDKVYFRRDPGRSYTKEGAARSWLNMSLNMSAHASFDEKTNWSVPKQAPSNVYNAKWAMPAKYGTETSLGWLDITVPFRNHWIHWGGPFTMDFRFSGGTLANNVKWGTDYHPYYLDGLNPTTEAPTYNEAQVSYYTSRCYVFDTQKVCFWTCLDSAFLPKDANKTYFQDLLASGRVYSDVYPGSAGKLSIALAARYAAPKAPVVWMTSLKGYSTGVDISARCNKLWLDPGAAVSYQTRTAASDGLSTYGMSVPFENAWAGHDVWFQAGYADSMTGRLSLTTAAKLRLPTKPVDIVSAKRYAVYHKTSSSAYTTGNGPYTSAHLQPLNLFHYHY